MSWKFKKPLSIAIDEEDPEHILSKEEQTLLDINTEILNFNNSLSPSIPSLIQYQTKERDNLICKDNNYLRQLFLYMESGNYLKDISFKHLQQSPELSAISKSVFVTPNEISISKRNIESEYRWIKWITEDDEHKSHQIDLDKNWKRSNNRYSDILPYTYNWVPFQNLHIYDNTNQEQWYINASYINGPFKADERCFIATQGPTNNTISKFYKMCFHQDIKLVIMLCSFEEEGRKKCEYYLPRKVNEEVCYDDVKVTLLNEECLLMNCLLAKEFTITINNVTKVLHHIQMTNWPDYSMPDNQTGYDTIEYLINIIGKYREKFSNSPILVHCSAGIGRTGSLIAIFNLVKCGIFYKQVNYDKDIQPFFSVFNMVRRLREQRNGMVSSWEQYTYIYKFIVEWINKNLVIE